MPPVPPTAPAGSARAVGNEKEDIVMRKHGFRSIFSLLLALMMVCSLLPTAAFAEGNLEPTDQVTEQPTDQPAGGEVQQPTEKKEDAPQGEQPATPPQTYAVVYADGAENTVFEAKSFPGLTSGEPTPPLWRRPRPGRLYLPALGACPRRNRDRKRHLHCPVAGGPIGHGRARWKPTDRAADARPRFRRYREQYHERRRSL